MLNVPYSRLQNDDLYALALRTDEILAPRPIDEMGITLYYNNFKKNYEKYKQSMQHISSNAKAVQLKDGVRDDYSRSFIRHIENYLCYPDEAIRKRVTELLQEIYKHGPNIQKRSYKKETTILETIIAKIEAEFMDLMEQTQAMVWLNLLKEAQTDFEKTLREYTKNKKDDEKVDAPTTVRPDLVGAMRKLFTFLPMQYELTGNEELGQIIEQLKVELRRF